MKISELKDNELIIVQIEYDRVVFLQIKNNKVVGINFHQGIDKIDGDFRKNSSDVMEIFETVENDDLIKKINETLELWMSKYLGGVYVAM